MLVVYIITGRINVLYWVIKLHYKFYWLSNSDSGNFSFIGNATGGSLTTTGTVLPCSGNALSSGILPRTGIFNLWISYYDRATADKQFSTKGEESKLQLAVNGPTANNTDYVLKTGSAGLTIRNGSTYAAHCAVGRSVHLIDQALHIVKQLQILNTKRYYRILVQV